MPYQTATNPDTGEKIINIDGAWKPLEASATHSDSGEKAYKVNGKWMTGEPGSKQSAQPAQAAPQDESEPGVMSQIGNVAKNAAGAVIEPAARVITGAAALPLEAGASLYKLATAPWGKKASEASKASQQVAHDFTYQPETEGGKTTSGIVDAVAKIPQDIANKVTDGIADNESVKKVLGAKGSEYLQAGLNTAIQAIPAVLGVRGAKGGLSVADATTAAQDFVKTKTKADWNSMPQPMKDRLVEVAKSDPKALERLKPEAIERQARFQKYDVPASKGQIERDKNQLTQEENQFKTKNSNVAKINDAQDERFHQILDEEVKKIGPSPGADTRGGVGDSVQGALGGRKAASEANYDALYAKARATEPDAQVSASPLSRLLDNKPHLQHLDFVEHWIDKADLKETIPATKGTPGTPPSKILNANGKPVNPGTPGTPGRPPFTFNRGLTLNELDDLRTEAVGVASKGGKDGFYASQVVKAIDRSMEKVPEAAKNWKAAIDAFRTHKQEFSDQGRIRALVEPKKGAKGDPAVAREDVFQHSIIKGSARNVEQVKTSLSNAGPEGAQAWKDLQAETLRHLGEKASGRREIQGETGSRQFNSSFVDTFNELDKDGKIDIIFDKPTATKLRDLAKMVHDARTKPGKGTSGSDTVPRALALTAGEKMTLLPGGHYLRAAGNLAETIHKRANAARQNTKARMSTLDEMARQSAKSRNSSLTLRNYRRAYAVGQANKQDDTEDDK